MLSFLKSAKEGWAARLKQGLARTRERLGRELSGLFSRHTRVDEALFEDLESRAHHVRCRRARHRSIC